MLSSTFPATVADLLSIVFGLSAAVQLAGPGFVQRAYQRWNFPRKFYRLTGFIELLIAFFLAVPQTRVWGIALAYLVTFVAVVTLLAHRQYVWSAPAIVLMVALVPAALDTPV